MSKNKDNINTEKTGNAAFREILETQNKIFENAYQNVLNTHPVGYTIEKPYPREYFTTTSALADFLSKTCCFGLTPNDNDLGVVDFNLFEKVATTTWQNVGLPIPIYALTLGTDLLVLAGDFTLKSSIALVNLSTKPIRELDRNREIKKLKSSQEKEMKLLEKSIGKIKNSHRIYLYSKINNSESSNKFDELITTVEALDKYEKALRSIKGYKKDSLYDYLEKDDYKTLTDFCKENKNILIPQDLIKKISIIARNIETFKTAFIENSTEKNLGTHYVENDRLCNLLKDKMKDLYDSLAVLLILKSFDKKTQSLSNNKEDLMKDLKIINSIEGVNELILKHHEKTQTSESSSKNLKCRGLLMN